MVSTSATTQRLQLHCDQPGCRTKFIPRAAAADLEGLRLKASAQGWATVLALPGVSGVDDKDLCPSHKGVR